MSTPFEVINTQNIYDVTFTINVPNFCPLGKADYTNEFEVMIRVGNIMADFCEIESEIKQRLSDEDLIIEDAMFELGKIVKKYYKDAKSIHVKSTVKDAAHFKVELKAVYR